MDRKRDRRKRKTRINKVNTEEKGKENRKKKFYVLHPE